MDRVSAGSAAKMSRGCCNSYDLRPYASEDYISITNSDGGAKRTDGMTSIKEKLVKGAIAGGIAGVASAVLFNESGNTNLFGLNMPIPVAIGLTNGSASVGADLAHEYIFPYIPGNQKYAQLESAALGLGVAGVGTAWLLGREGLSPSTFMNGAVLGAGSYAAADWIDSRFLGGSSDTFLF